MREVAIVGIGQTPVGEHWDIGIRHLALEALQAAMHDGHVERVDAVYVGNMLAGELTGQKQLGALVADFSGLRGIEALRVEAGGCGGAAALRLGYMAVASEMCDLVLVVGVEKMTDAASAATTSALAMSADADYETAHGVSFAALNGLLTRRYMYEYGYAADDWSVFAINAHANGMNNPNAMFHIRLKPEPNRTG